MALKDKIRYFRSYIEFKKAGGKITQLFPVYKGYRKQAGSATGHYFHQDLLVAGYIHKNNPLRHIDIGSSIEGFVAHVASFPPIEVFDVRALQETGHSNIKFKQMDLMEDAGIEFEACDSLSCLHAIEHFGLGRYGDPINPVGHITGFKNLLKMLKPKGILYISFPISSEDQVLFNAHRVFKPDSILNWQSDVPIEVTSFSFVDDAGNLHKDVELAAVPKNTSYGCGIYSIRKC